MLQTADQARPETRGELNIQCHYTDTGHAALLYISVASSTWLFTRVGRTESPSLPATTVVELFSAKSQWVAQVSPLARAFISRYRSSSVSTAKTLAQLNRLTPEERDAVRARFNAIDEVAPHTVEEKRMVDERGAAYRRNPGAAKSGAVAESEIRKQLGL